MSICLKDNARKKWVKKYSMLFTTLNHLEYPKVTIYKNSLKVSLSREYYTHFLFGDRNAIGFMVPSGTARGLMH